MGATKSTFMAEILPIQNGCRAFRALSHLTVKTTLCTGVHRCQTLVSATFIPRRITCVHSQSSIICVAGPGVLPMCHTQDGIMVPVQRLRILELTKMMTSMHLKFGRLLPAPVDRYGRMLAILKGVADEDGKLIQW